MYADARDVKRNFVLQQHALRGNQQEAACGGEGISTVYVDAG